MLLVAGNSRWSHWPLYVTFLSLTIQMCFECISGDEGVGGCHQCFLGVHYVHVLEPDVNAISIFNLKKSRNTAYHTLKRFFATSLFLYGSKWKRHIHKEEAVMEGVLDRGVHLSSKPNTVRIWCITQCYTLVHHDTDACILYQCCKKSLVWWNTLTEDASDVCFGFFFFFVIVIIG